MKRERIFGIALALLLAAGAGVLISKVSESSSTPAAAVATPKPKRAVVPKLARAAIDELAVFGPKGAVQLQLAQGKWRTAVPADAPADDRAVNAALEVLTTLDSKGVVTEDESLHDELGVDPEHSIRVVVRSKSQTLLEAHIGNYEPGVTMFRVGGFATVFKVRGALRFAFDKRPAEWRVREIGRLDSSAIRGLEFRNRNGHFRFERAGQDAWTQVLEPGQTRIDPLNSHELSILANIASNLNAVEFYSAGLSDEQTGLGDQASTVVLSFTGSVREPRVLRIGYPAPGNNYYFKIEGADAVYAIAPHVAERLMPSPQAGSLQQPQVARPGAPSG